MNIKILPNHSWKNELKDTMTLAWPLIVSQLAGILLFTTDVVMMGWLGAKYLAAGTLATSLLHLLFIGSVGVISACAPLIAQAIGAKKIKDVRRIVRQGFWISFVLTLIIVPIFFSANLIFLFFGQNEEISQMAQTYLYFASGAILPGLMFIALRSLLQVRGATMIILYITICGIFINAFGNYILMFGNFGFPRLELAGAGISTSFVNLMMFLFILFFVLFHKKYKRFYVLYRLFKPDWERFFGLLKLGIPIGLTIMSEIGMFSIAVIMMGWLGTNEVAAHAIALQCAAIAFMLPLGLSQATTVRVGLFAGAKNHDGIKKAGWTSFFITVFLMSITSALFIFVPGLFIGLFLNPLKAENILVISLAVSYLGIAALFQFADGAQVIMAASLRGLSDTKVPMFIAIFGYWIFGIGIAYYAAFNLEMRGVGVWIGLASGLSFVAIILSLRFLMRERLGLLSQY